MELAHIKMAPRIDEFCKACKIATSGSAARHHIGTPSPQEAFKFIYGDIIHSPTKQGPTAKSNVLCFLHLVCAYTKYSWFKGMKDFLYESLIETLKQCLVHTYGKTHKLQYVRTDAGTAFTSSEFKRFSQGKNHFSNVCSSVPPGTELNK
eukprot:4079190-Ditylum_brightwellii.AAC.1